MYQNAQKVESPLHTIGDKVNLFICIHMSIYIMDSRTLQTTLQYIARNLQQSTTTQMQAYLNELLALSCITFLRKAHIFYALSSHPGEQAFPLSLEFYLSLNERWVCTLVRELFAGGSKIPFPFAQISIWWTFPHHRAEPVLSSVIYSPSFSKILFFS